MRKKIEMLLMSGALVLALPITVSASAGMPEVQAADLETPQSEVLEQPILEKINGNTYLVYSDGTHYTGWYQTVEGKMYFDPVQDGAALVGLNKIDHKAYVFNDNGILYTGAGTPLIGEKKYWLNTDGSLNSGWLYLDNWKMYFDEETYEAKVGLRTIDGKRYIFDDNGVMQSYAGTPVINGRKYWFSEDGSLRTGWLNLGNWKMYFDPDTCEARVGLSAVGEKRYIFDNNGVMQSYAGTPVINGRKYWFSEDGSLRTGWLNLGNWKMYFDPDTCEARTGLSKVGEKRYIFDDNGVMQSYAGTPVINGKKYWFSEDGSLRSGWLNLGNWRMYFDPNTCQARIGLSVVEGKRYMFDNNGVMQSYAGTSVINGKKYWFSEDGSLHTGWLELEGWKMYFDPDTCEAAIGVQNIGGKNYAFDKNGVLITGNGTQVVNGKKYWINADGSVETGWKTLGGWTFYFHPETGEAATGITTIGGKRYLFDQNGVWLTGSGTVEINEKKYCFQSDGTVVTGWVIIGKWVRYFNQVTGEAATGMTVIDGKQYYFDKNGVRTSGSQFINGKQYYFGANGELLRRTWVIVNGEKIYVDGNGVGLTDLSAQYPGPYKLVVDRTNCVVTAYAKDSLGRYTIPVRSMVCSVGLAATETPTGTYYTSAKFKLKELMGPSWGKWATRVVGGIYFHSVATSSATDPTHAVPAGEYNKLGRPASHGCIRLCVRDAKWIYDHCGLGTQVQIGDNYSMPFGKPTLPKISGSVDPTDPAV